MDNLAFDLKHMCDHNRDGSHATQDNRRRNLAQAASIIKSHGYKLPSAKSIKPKHIMCVVKDLQAGGASPGRQKNMASALRWWAGKVNKASIIPRDNSDLGIAERKASTGNRAQKLDMAKVNSLPCKNMQMSLRMASAFGLRLEEAIKIKPGQADKGDKLALQASWTKGGKAREIPIHSEKHRALLNEAKALAKDGSLIPADKSYIQHRKSLEHQTLKAGMTNLHGLRHNYAQWRYGQLTGWKCPKDGGPKKLNAQQREIDRQARQQISRELGHERLDVTKTYLG